MFEEELQALEENQKKILMEYETCKEDLKKSYKKFMSEPGISQNKQQECYKGESVSERIILIHIKICSLDKLDTVDISPPNLTSRVVGNLWKLEIISIGPPFSSHFIKKMVTLNNS